MLLLTSVVTISFVGKIDTVFKAEISACQNTCYGFEITSSIVSRFDFDQISNLIQVDVSFGYGPSVENSFLTFSDSLASPA